jgi:hypothetical protein
MLTQKMSHNDAEDGESGELILLDWVQLMVELKMLVKNSDIVHLCLQNVHPLLAAIRGNKLHYSVPQNGPFQSYK